MTEALRNGPYGKCVYDADNDVMSQQVVYPYYPFPKRQILDSSKLKEFSDDNFKLDGNGRTSSKSVENTVENGEIACHEQFLLFLQCFQKTCSTDT